MATTTNPNISLGAPAYVKQGAVVGEGGVKPRGAAGRSRGFTQVATRSRIPGNRSGSVFQLMAKSYHHARDNIYTLKAAFANWYVLSGVEAGIGGPATVRATVEYPLGTILGRFLFGGQTTGTVQDLQTAFSDELVLSATIPEGAKFFINVYYTNAAGIPFVYTDSIGADQAGGDLALYGASGIADVTGSGGNFANSQPGVGYYPVLILANTSKRAYAISGDSKASGKGDDVSDGTGFGGGLERSIGTRCPFINIANAGAGANTFTGPGSNLRRQLLGFVDGVVYDAGINDVTGGTVAPTIVDYWVKARESVPNHDFYLCTQSPSTTGTFTSPAGQTVTGNEAIRVAVNDMAKSPAQSIFTAVFDVGAVNESAPGSGKWASNRTADGIHPNQASCQAVAASGVVTVPA